MALFKASDSFDDLRDLLERERALVLDADFLKLKRLVAEKERMFFAMLPTISDPKKLWVLREIAGRNQELLDAAGRGIRAAAGILKSAAEPVRPLSTYDKSGKRDVQLNQTHTTERRA